MTPQGWDDEIPEEVLNGMREVRKLYVAMLATGFTEVEAARIIGAIVGSSLSSAGGGSE